MSIHIHRKSMNHPMEHPYSLVLVHLLTCTCISHHIYKRHGNGKQYPLDCRVIKTMSVGWSYMHHASDSSHRHHYAGMSMTIHIHRASHGASNVACIGASPHMYLSFPSHIQTTWKYLLLPPSNRCINAGVKANFNASTCLITRDMPESI
jgi:hypothetical protein